MSHADQKRRSPLRRTLLGGLTVSLLLHAGLLAVIAFGSVHNWLDTQPLHVIQASTTYARTDPPVEGPTEDAAPEPMTHATVVIQPEDPAPAGIRQQLDASLAKSEQLSEEEKVEVLDDATRRLQRISSEAAVEDVAVRLQSWLGLTPRAEQPVTDGVVAKGPLTEPAVASEKSADEFDLDTAQLHDVHRLVGSDDRPRYLCIMLDAKGRTLEVPLSEAEGAPIYTLMEKIKASPLLEQIYRQLAMPMLDQLISAERAATAAADAARSHAAASEELDEAATSGQTTDSGTVPSR